MKLYRARAWRGGPGPATFDALDSSPSVAGPKGWRFNDLATEILYAAEVEALATLEVAVRPGWETIEHVLIATIEVPDGSDARVVKALDGTGFKERRLRAWCTGSGVSPADANDHFQRLARLLDLESQAEAQQILENPLAAYDR